MKAFAADVRKMNKMISIEYFFKEVKKMKDLKGTKTEANLMAAFAGESQATNK